MGLKNWHAPVALLSRNAISLIGVILTTTAGVLWLILLPDMLTGRVSHPYLGIAMFVFLPAVFFAGLALMPIGIWLKRRSDRKKGIRRPEPVTIDVKSPDFRRLIA